MSDKQIIIEKIKVVFQEIEFPGERFLQGSFDGSEPYEEIAPFQARKNWEALDADFLDKHAAALGFFSEAGFRFFLPAYLIADLNGQLKTADPVFHLTQGFYDFSVTVPIAGSNVVIKSGKSTLINPRRYGAATYEDYARYRLSIFTREEVRVIVKYLQHKCDRDDFEKERVNAALEAFWLKRAQTAPSIEILRRHVEDEKKFVETIQSDMQKRNDQL